MTGEHDYSTDGAAWVGRELKAKKLARWCWDRGIGPLELHGPPSATPVDARTLNRLARAADVNPAHGGSTGPTWAAVRDLLHGMAEFAATHPDHPAARRPHRDEHAQWINRPALRVVTDPTPVTPAPPDSPRSPTTPPGPLPPPADAAPSPRPADTITAQRAAHLPPGHIAGVVRGWAELAALPPVPDRTCSTCDSPAVVGALDGWRCSDHPPGPEDWGHILDWTPTGTACTSARCWCGRHPHYRPARSPLLAILDADTEGAP